MSDVTADAETEPDVEETAEPEPPATAWGVPVTESRGQVVLHPSRDELLATAKTLADDGFVSVLDLCGADYQTYSARRELPAGVTAERFELIVTLISHVARQRVRLRVQVPADDPVVPSLFDVYPGTEAMERETWDMFGIGFDGHPMLTRILMPEDWEGHPLRKAYATGAIPVQFKGAPASR